MLHERGFRHLLLWLGCLCLAAPAFAQSACVAAAIPESYRPALEVDPFEGTERLYTSAGGSVIEEGRDGQVALTFMRIRHPERSDGELQLVVTYAGPLWLFVEPGMVASLLLDGRRTDVTATELELQRQVAQRGGVVESATVTLEADLLREIVGADSVLVRMYGTEGTVTANLSHQVKCVGERFLQAIDVAAQRRTSGTEAR